MSSRAERIRREMAQGSLFKHSMNARQVHFTFESERKVYRKDKGARAEERRKRRAEKLAIGSNEESFNTPQEDSIE